MTEHVDTMDAVFLERLLEGGMIISRDQPSTGWSEIGSQQVELGFGEDANAAFMNQFIKAMVAVELRPRINLKTRQVLSSTIEATWSATVKSLISKAPADVFRLDRGQIFTPDGQPLDPKKYREENIPLYRYLFGEYVEPYGTLLIPQYTPSIYSFDYLTMAHPYVTSQDLIHDQPGWRYQVMAQMLWYELGPNLRTLEMVHPNAVWRRLNQYFWQVQNLHGHWELMRAGSRRRERASFILAIYERTLNLLHERWQDTVRYRAMISHRQPANGNAYDPIIYVPPKKGKPYSMDEALTIRVAAYDELLFSTLSNCFGSLRNLK